MPRAGMMWTATNWGTHRGTIHYTIGQRKGLGLALGKPMYVKATDAEKNTVTLATNDQLFSSKVSRRKPQLDRRVTFRPSR